MERSNTSSGICLIQQHICPSHIIALVFSVLILHIYYPIKDIVNIIFLLFLSLCLWRYRCRFPLVQASPQQPPVPCRESFQTSSPGLRVYVRKVVSTREKNRCMCLVSSCESRLVKSSGRSLVYLLVGRPSLPKAGRSKLRRSCFLPFSVNPVLGSGRRISS